MPELPEVETIKLGLQKYLIGKEIEDVEIRIPKLFVGSISQIIGAKITGLKRIGKSLIIELNNDFVLAIHLKMTGQVVFQDDSTKNIILSPKVGGDKLPSKFTHIIFKLNGNSYLYYNDLRQFGWIKVIRKDELMNVPFFKNMGPEPFKDLTLGKFNEILNNNKTTIKTLLMDQKKIGGIGNIYANDALFKAGIDPRRSVKQITSKEITRLYDAINFVLKKSLEYGGSSDENFVNSLGQEGNYQKHALVYGKEKEKCNVCGQFIQKIKLGGRGTYFCPRCQR